MKKFYLACSLFFFHCMSLHAQNLYGVTFYGGDHGTGTIDKFIPSVPGLPISKSLASFASNPGRAGLVQASDGKLYGMTSNGGSLNGGVIFSYDPAASKYTEIINIDIKNGSPVGSLVEAIDGKLYGVTIGGGQSGNGLIFSFDAATKAFTVIREFDNVTGANPAGSLVQASDHKLYGLTTTGGNNGSFGGDGVMYSYDPATTTYTVLRDFDFTYGSSPFGSLIEGADGQLYGTTLFGGYNNDGVLFAYDPPSSSFSKLFDFDENSGSNPAGSLVKGDDGLFYGVTTELGTTAYGSLFSFDPLTVTYNKLLDFDPDKGNNPYSGLIAGPDKKFYGMTTRGGSMDAGVIFSFDPATQAYNKIQEFNELTGSSPGGSLIEANDGKIYGMTGSTGSGTSTDDGVLFSFDPAMNVYNKLKEFGVNRDGSNISGSLTKAKDGKLYGMTTNGGSNTLGVIFSIDPFSSKYTKLNDFDFADGCQPYGHMLQAGDGKMYGMTSLGGFDPGNVGDNNIGVIFSFDPVSNAYARVMKFDSYNHRTGGTPYGSLIQAKDNKLYGMTSNGGGGYRGMGAGTIFSFDLSSMEFTPLKDFATFDDQGIYMSDSNGVYPYGDLLQANDGKFYGLTSGGGNSEDGVLFSFDATTGTYTILQELDTSTGTHPYGTVIQAKDGKLYGMTWGGGYNDGGVIFSYDIVESKYTKLKDFEFSDGFHPYGNLMQASDGKLYGMTSSGGDNDYGVIFSFDPTSSVYTKLVDYDGTNGSSPYFGSAFIELGDAIVTPVTTLNNIEQYKILPNPSRGQFAVDVKVNTSKQVSFQLFTLSGVRVYQSQIYNVYGEQTIQINAGDLSNGVYYLQTTMGTESFTRKLVVIR